jgi:predicted aminopeptidase
MKPNTREIEQRARQVERQEQREAVVREDRKRQTAMSASPPPPRESVAEIKADFDRLWSKAAMLKRQRERWREIARRLHTELEVRRQ